MQASVIPSSHIRPLGSEHLRMFGRTLNSPEEAGPKVALPESAFWPKGLPEPTSKFSFTVCDRKYVILRYKKRKGPTFEQTVMTAEQMGLPMLTLEEVLAIRGDSKSDRAFKTQLNIGEMLYIRNPESEKRSHVTFLMRARDGNLRFGSNDLPDIPARVTILRRR